MISSSVSVRLQRP